MGAVLAFRNRPQEAAPVIVIAGSPEAVVDFTNSLPTLRSASVLICSGVPAEVDLLERQLLTAGARLTVPRGVMARVKDAVLRLSPTDEELKELTLDVLLASVARDAGPRVHLIVVSGPSPRGATAVSMAGGLVERVRSREALVTRLVAEDHARLERQLLDALNADGASVSAFRPAAFVASVTARAQSLGQSVSSYMSHALEDRGERLAIRDGCYGAFLPPDVEVVRSICDAASGRSVRLWIPMAGTDPTLLDTLAFWVELADARSVRLKLIVTDSRPDVIWSLREAMPPSVQDSITLQVHDAFEDPPFTGVDLLTCGHAVAHLVPEARDALLGRLCLALDLEGTLALEPGGQFDDPDFSQRGDGVFVRTDGEGMESGVRATLPATLQAHATIPVTAGAPWRDVALSHCAPGIAIDLNAAVVGTVGGLPLVKTLVEWVGPRVAKRVRAALTARESTRVSSDAGSYEIVVHEEGALVLSSVEDGDKEPARGKARLLRTQETLRRATDDLQTVNEELFQENARLHTRVAALEDACDHLLRALAEGPGVVWLDRHFVVRAANGAGRIALGLSDADIGRPLADEALVARLRTEGDLERVTDDERGTWDLTVSRLGGDVLVSAKPILLA